MTTRNEAAGNADPELRACSYRCIECGGLRAPRRRFCGKCFTVKRHNFPEDIDEDRACQYACPVCSADAPTDTDCPACLEREVDGTAEELSELQERLEDEDEIAELAIEEMDNA